VHVVDSVELAERDAPEVQGTLLERPVLLFVEAERLGDVVDLEGTDGEVHGDLDVLGEVALEATEQPE